MIGDSFGPLIGYKLKTLFRDEENIKVFGTLDNIICMHNISNVINEINSTYQDSFIIAVDAAFSKRNNIGRIVVSKDSLNVRSAFNKSNIYVGNMSIKGVVAKDFNNPKYNFKILLTFM